MTQTEGWGGSSSGIVICGFDQTFPEKGRGDVIQVILKNHYPLIGAMTESVLRKKTTENLKIPLMMVGTQGNFHRLLPEHLFHPFQHRSFGTLHINFVKIGLFRMLQKVVIEADIVVVVPVGYKGGHDDHLLSPGCKRSLQRFNPLTILFKEIGPLQFLDMEQ